MDSFSHDEESQFFDAQEDFLDAREDIESSSETSRDSIEVNNSNFGLLVEGSFAYDFWNRSPLSVKERRTKFLRMMRLKLDRISDDNSIVVHSNVSGGEASTTRENGEAMVGIPAFEDGFYSSQSSMSCFPSESCEVLEELRSKNNFLCSDETADCSCSGESSSSCSSQSSQQQKELRPANPRHFEDLTRRVDKSWLRRLSSIACVFDSHNKGVQFKSDNEDEDRTFRVQRVKVRQSKKQSKELSALFTGHDIQAHEGAILVMKFSVDGRYLASGGEDGIVKVWQVIEDERSNERDIPVFDQSCIYLSVNHLSELKPLLVDKDKLCNSASLKKTSESACVIFPPKIFRILEKPLHEFSGHNCEILDLSWSREKYLLSSSVDKTVRLWRVGSKDCLKVFSHSNYVTCVQFNPVDENYFMSGSIDGKVRIWGISCSQVVDWTNIREIVTAVCYRPDGQGSVVGSIDGNCRFYTISDNHLQLEAQIGLHSKKKSASKKITSFQFLPQDSSMLMVSSADSQIRILRGPNAVGKFKGICNAGNQISASLTSDGKYIISACGNSNVYVWNCGDQNDTSLSRAKRCYEHFSANASIAIPWSGFGCGNLNGERQLRGFDWELSELLPFSSSAQSSLNQEFFLESLPKGSATWPEEKIPTSSNLRMHKSRCKFLKESCRSASESHAWGLVIVTAGWDGRIRWFHSYGLPAPV